MRPRLAHRGRRFELFFLFFAGFDSTGATALAALEAAGDASGGVDDTGGGGGGQRKRRRRRRRRRQGGDGDATETQSTPGLDVEGYASGRAAVGGGEGQGPWLYDGAEVKELLMWVDNLGEKERKVRLGVWGVRIGVVFKAWELGLSLGVRA